MLGAMAYETKKFNAKSAYYAMQAPVLSKMLAVLYMATGRHRIERQLDEAFSPDIAPPRYKEKFLSLMFRISQLKAAASDEITINPCLRQMSSDYSKINLPVVIVAGDQDRTVPPLQHSYPLHKAIANSQLIVIHNAGHELQFTRQAEVMTAINLALQTVVRGPTVAKL